MSDVRFCETCDVAYVVRSDYRDVHDALAHTTRDAVLDDIDEQLWTRLTGGEGR